MRPGWPDSSANRSSSRVGELLGGHRAQPPGGQFDGQRQALHPPAELGDLVGGGEAGDHGGGAFGEQQQRVGLGQRADPEDAFGRMAERLAAGDQETDAGSRRQHLADEGPGGPDEVFDGVQDDQQAVIGEVCGQHLALGPDRLLRKAERSGDRVGEQITVALGGQFGHPDRLQVNLGVLFRRAERQTRLPHAARTGERHQGRLGEQSADLGQLRVSPDEGTGFRRKVHGRQAFTAPSRLWGSGG